MARGEGEPSAKRAKGDEADEEEDPLVRRREELVRLLEEASAKGEDNARAKEELLTLCARLEAKNEKRLSHFRRLPTELWQKIVDQNDLLALAMTCRFFRDTTKDLGKKMRTNLCEYNIHLYTWQSGKVASHTLGWFQWVCDTFEILPGFEDRWSMRRVKGAVHEGDLLNYAVFQGSIEILRWLMEEKGCKLNWNHTGEWAGMGGSIEVLEYLWETGNLGIWGGEWEHEFTSDVCAGAARGGHLEALKWARSQDPPFPWYEETCTWAAYGGHFDVLKWVRDQDPPCPWNEWSCANAAEGGHLDILKWARSQNPPCPWSRHHCRKGAASHNITPPDHIVEWIDQQEDESDCDSEYYDMMT